MFSALASSLTMANRPSSSMSFQRKARASALTMVLSTCRSGASHVEHSGATTCLRPSCFVMVDMGMRLARPWPVVALGAVGALLAGGAMAEEAGWRLADTQVPEQCRAPLISYVSIPMAARSKPA
jgi:hypothetical protein